MGIIADLYRFSKNNIIPKLCANMWFLLDEPLDFGKFTVEGALRNIRLLTNLLNTLPLSAHLHFPAGRDWA
jgi:hypothetical protein